MSKFIFKFGKEQEVREGDRVSVGTRSTATFTLEDPLAADIHCDILVRGDEFVVIDRGGTLGTFVNGIRVVEAHPLADGDQIVCAVSRINVAIKGDEITLNQDRTRFYYDDKKDGLDLSRREVAFGRFRPVSVGNWAVAFIMLILFPLCYIGTTSEILVEPGETWHGNMAAYHHALSKLDADSQDCNACHDTFSGTPASKCMDCHQDDIGPHDMHPFYTTAEEWGDACVKCHIDHRGTHELALIARPAKETCGECHDATKKLTMQRASSLPTVNVGVTYNTFAHADHLQKQINGRAIACADCHRGYDDQVAMADRAIEGERRREFAPVDYDACMACHSGAHDDVKNLKEEWHGTDDEGKNCLTCHNAVNTAELKQVDFTPGKRTFSLTSRSHAAEMAKAEAAGGQKCAECHKNGEELGGGRPFAARRFEHVTHVLDLAPKTDELKMKLSGDASNPKTGECAHCHTDTVMANTLASDSPHHYSNVSCTTCHTTGEVKESQSMAVRIKRNDFPHGLHMKVTGGCYACHDFNNDDLSMDVSTPADIKSCVKCHSSHQDVGEGHCADCHKKIEGVYDGVYTGIPLPWDRRPDKTYSHFSPGHRGLTNAGKCTDCHGEDIWQTKTIDAIKIPVEDDPKCRDCHLKERFHWR